MSRVLPLGLVLLDATARVLLPAVGGRARARAAALRSERVREFHAEPTVRAAE